MIKNINITDAEVSAELHGYMYLALYDYQGILHAGSRMTAEIISNNEIKINDGILCNYGRFMRIVGSETVRIENGSSGVKRTDLIVVRFTTTGTKETHTLTVIKGPAGGAEPSYNRYWNTRFSSLCRASKWLKYCIRRTQMSGIYEY